MKERLIVCYNLLPVQSSYWWKGKILEENETLMIIKTKKGNFKKIEKYINTHSGYEIPEVILLDVLKVNTPYLNWLSSEVK